MHNVTIRNYLQPISKLWNHSWNTEIEDFIVQWSENTSFVTIWVTLWITAFYEEKAKVFCITLQHLREFYHFTTKLINKSHTPQWEFGQQFPNFKTKLCKNRNGMGIWHLWEFLKVISLLMWSCHESCNQIPRGHLDTVKHVSYIQTTKNMLQKSFSKSNICCIFIANISMNNYMLFYSKVVFVVPRGKQPNVLIIHSTHSAQNYPRWQHSCSVHSFLSKIAS